MTQYMQEQRVFNRLKQDCTLETKQEYELAISTLLERYNTTIYENRFVAGGAVEVFTYALLRTVGIDCGLYGNQSKSGDILLPNAKILSVKGAFTGGATDIRLLNKQGGGYRPWEAATLFVLSDVGIVFGAPDMVSEDLVHDTSDALVLKKQAITELMSDPVNVLPMEIMKKPPTEMTGFSHKASTAVARQIIIEADLSKLNSALDPNAIPGLPLG